MKNDLQAKNHLNHLTTHMPVTFLQVKCLSALVWQHYYRMVESSSNSSFTKAEIAAYRRLGLQLNRELDYMSRRER